MSRVKINRSTLTFCYCAAVFGFVAVALWFGAASNPAIAGSNGGDKSAIPQATFAGTNIGAIPDGLSGTPPQFGAPRTINFAVTGVVGFISNISVDFTATHTWVGDVEMVLAAPGGTPSMHLASRIGVTTAGSFGDSSNFGGTYFFNDIAAGSNIWTVATAAACGDACIVAPGTYRTVATGQIGQTNPAPVTSLLANFGGLSAAQANGTWTLTFRDAASADTGSVTAANLIINSGDPPLNGTLDFNGDGRSDYVVVRNVGGGPGGQVRWFYNLSSGGPTVALDWGLTGTDFFVVKDFDGDNKDDVAVFRPNNTPGQGAFYILNSATNTARVEAFGLPGDDPTVVDDYDGDGKADIAVYRGGAAAGQQSFWFYRSSFNPGGGVTYVPWGQSGDFPMPGDVDGDGKADFTIQRNNGIGQGAFWTRFSTGAVKPVTVFGLSSDLILPGDYDGDGKTDIAVARAVSGQIQWHWLRSSDNGVVGPIAWGLSATDFPTQGDYDGDGKTDISIWRPSANANQSAFYTLSSTNNSAVIFAFGSQGDYPVANFNSH